jgi:hypothetical protein
MNMIFNRSINPNSDVIRVIINSSFLSVTTAFCADDSSSSKTEGERSASDLQTRTITKGYLTLLLILYGQHLKKES